MTTQQTVAGRRLSIRLRSQWDRALVLSLGAAFLVLAVSGRQQLAQSTSNSEQVAFLISGGFGGLFLVFMAITMLLVAELRDAHHKLDRVDLALRGEALAAPAHVLAQLEAGTLGTTVAAPSGKRWWTSRPVLSCAALWAVGGALVTGGWLTAAGTGSLARAMDGLAVAAAGLGLALAGLVSLSLGAGITRARRLRRLSAQFRDVVTAVEDGNHPGGDGGASTSASGSWSASGLRRFHRRSCVALVHAEGTPYPVDITAADLELCLICHHEPEGIDRDE